MAEMLTHKGFPVVDNLVYINANNCSMGRAQVGGKVFGFHPVTVRPKKNVHVKDAEIGSFELISMHKYPVIYIDNGAI